MNKTKISANAKFCFRSDTLENWESTNPKLEKGEFAVVLTDNEIEKVKIGDGATPFNELGWWKGGKGESAYEIAVSKGFEGTEEEWLDSFSKVDQYFIPSSSKPQSGTAVAEAISAKQDKLIAGLNIKTINGKSILGYGDLGISNPGSGSGENGATFTPNVSTDGIISWTNDKGLSNPAPVNIKGKDGYTPIKGKDYNDGDDGYSPIVAVSKSGKVTTINITDKNGKKTATINDGEDGGKGADGVSATHSWNGTTLTITSASGTSSANLKGETGASGSNGNDGVGIKSVVQTTTSSADGGSNVITVTKTDNTTSTFTVKNGSKGSTGSKGADGRTPVKGEDYFTETDKQELIELLKQETALIKNSVYAPMPQLPANGQKIGDPIGGGGGRVPDFDNAIDPAECTLNQRISSTNAIKDANGNIFTDYIPAISTDKIYVNLPLTNLNTDYSRVKFYSGASGNYAYITSADAKLGAQFTITEEEGYCCFALNTYNGGTLGAAYTAIRLVLNIKGTEKVVADDIKDLVVTVNEPITYTESDGEKATVDADFDGKNIKAQDIYNYMDKLVAKYPKLIAKEVLGKDASNTYDWCRYVFGRHSYDAWMRKNYPPMYAWVNGSTTIYSVSVSPRVGDTLYTTKYIGTSKGTVTAVSNANQTRTVGGIVYTRDKTKDIEPTLVYTETAYNPNLSSIYQGIKNEVSRDVSGVKTRVGSITTINGDTMSCSDGLTYTRYPLGDRDEKYQLKPTILLGANEHGQDADGSGDAREPAIITSRLAKDLCECDPKHAYLNMLRDNYKIVLVPIINPYGFTVGSYTNSNNVNIDRNFDTVGWGNDSVDQRHGQYGGSENETQYWMNTCVSSKAIVGMANHSYGRKIDSTTGEIATAGTCGCMIPRPNDAYDEIVEHIEMIMAGYNLSLIFSNSAEPENHAKTRSYMDSVGIKCCALEMQVSEGFLLHKGGQMYTERVMEANYTLLLQFLYMLIYKN